MEGSEDGQRTDIVLSSTSNRPLDHFPEEAAEKKAASEMRRKTVRHREVGCLGIGNAGGEQIAIAFLKPRRDMKLHKLQGLIPLFRESEEEFCGSAEVVDQLL
jgi:hypothetical protein